MHRRYLIDLLNNYFPSSADELSYKARILAFVNNNSNCFDRELLQGHVTASAWVLNKTHDQALLLHHAKFDVWCQPGGHCDSDPNVLNVAIKEVQEESGISAIAPLSTAIFDIDIHSLPPFEDVAAHYHYDIRFLLQAQSDAPLVRNRESKALRWFGKQQELLPTKEESVLRMFRKWCAL